jgi:hypothetical protein
MSLNRMACQRLGGGLCFPLFRIQDPRSKYGKNSPTLLPWVQLSVGSRWRPTRDPSSDAMALVRLGGLRAPRLRLNVASPSL